MQQLRGHHQYESANTLRNSVLASTIPKETRFREEPRGSQHTELKVQGDSVLNVTQALKRVGLDPATGFGKPTRTDLK